jgi:hypothetical protein
MTREWCSLSTRYRSSTGCPAGFDDDLDAVADAVAGRRDAVARTARGLLADSVRTDGRISTLPAAAERLTAQ